MKKGESKNIRFTDDEMKAIQEYADLYFDGIFSMAVRRLVREGLKKAK